MLRGLESSSSQVSTTMPLFPTACSIAGTFCASQLSPTTTVQPENVSCELLQLLGITNARLGSALAAMSAARSVYGRSFVWSRLEK